MFGESCRRCAPPPTREMIWFFENQNERGARAVPLGARHGGSNQSSLSLSGERPFQRFRAYMLRLESSRSHSLKTFE